MRRRRRQADIKSNNPHLTGGEKNLSIFQQIRHHSSDISHGEKYGTPRHRDIERPLPRSQKKRLFTDGLNTKRLKTASEI